MKHIAVCAAAIIAASSAAFAQTRTNPPGGNVPVAQGPCAKGYDGSREGRPHDAQRRDHEVGRHQ